MKRTVKAWLHRAGLLDPIQHLYFNLKTASPSVVAREIRYRRSKASDGFPVPPASLIFDVIACRWGAVYLDAGVRLVDDMEAVLHSNGLSLSSFERVLDFGCGCGRLIRHVHGRTDAELYGSDYNAELIGWCRRHLPFARFTTNELAPPLDFGNETFDFVYARSVFTHLPEELQRRWIRELHRVLQDGGYLYLTMHGRPLARGLDETQRARFDAGDLVVTYSSLAGQNLCSTFASRAYVERTLLDGFELIDFVEGREAAHLRQDIYLLRKKTV